MPNELEKTLKRDVTISGKGLFTGEEVEVKLCPAKKGEGVYFQRTDIPEQPVIPANLDYVHQALRCTCLADNDVSILMVEHLLSTVHAFGIDHLRIELRGSELPSGDGSARIYVEALQKAETVELETQKKIYRLKDPVHYSHGESHLVALPADEYKVSYTLHYPN